MRGRGNKATNKRFISAIYFINMGANIGTKKLSESAVYATSSREGTEGPMNRLRNATELAEPSGFLREHEAHESEIKIVTFLPTAND